MPDFQKQIIGIYGSYKVYRVNGELIRNSSSTNEEFGESAIHEDFPGLIPEGEFWIEDNVPQNEVQFIITNLLFRQKLLLGGMAKDKAYDRALEYERQIRQNYNPKHIGDIRVSQLGAFDRYIIWLVDGFAVRARYKTDFIEGGNHSRYPWIPFNEIWIEVALHLEEYPYILAHEVIEDYVMGHIGWPYERAHKLASAVEFELRKRSNVTVPLAIPYALDILRKMKIPGPKWLRG